MSQPSYRMVQPALYAIAKEYGITIDSDDFNALQAAFILGQSLMRDAAITKLASYKTGRCAHIVRSLPLLNGVVGGDK